MELDYILTFHNLSKADYYPLSPEPNSFVQYISEEPFYVSPSFADVYNPNSVLVNQPKVILFSATGAMGKSALAKYLAYKLKGLYWNLSRMTLGHNTFHGTLIRCIGDSNFSSFMNGLNSGRSLLIIDALDEADLISGREMLRIFLTDIFEKCKFSSSPSIILLSRSGTARYILSLCQNQISIAHYEIRFFPFPKARTFIEKKLEQKKRNSPADLQCINEYLSLLRTKMSGIEFDSFIGYAPVLEAIAAHIISVPNAARFISDLASSNDSSTVIMKILSDLLEREHVKFSEAFNEACINISPNTILCEEVYRQKEQLFYLTQYILFSNEIEFQPPECGFSLPPNLILEYTSRLTIFVPQHPFIQNSFFPEATQIIDFAGPAFRDYVTASMLLSGGEDETIISLYCSEPRGSTFFPSRLFWDFYMVFSSQKVFSRHVSYLYDSYKAKMGMEDQPILGISENNENGLSFEIDFGRQKNGKSPSFASFPLHMSPEMVISLPEIINSTIIVPNIVVSLGQKGRECRISDSIIIAKEIHFQSEKIIIESSRESECTIVSVGEFKNPDNLPISFRILSDGNLRISSTNINHFYGLIKYRFLHNDELQIKPLTFCYALRSILRDFRKDRNDRYGKYADKIDNLAVGGNFYQKRVLEYLYSEKILYCEGNMYLIDSPTFNRIGVNYDSIRKMETEPLTPLFNHFLLWERAQKK